MSTTGAPTAGRLAVGLAAAGAAWWVLRRVGRRFVLPRILGAMHRRRLRFFDAETPRPGEIVFLGDSITENGDWAGFFPAHDVRNLGSSGDTTRGVRRRLHHAIDSAPAKIFLLIGTNDVAFGIPMQETRENVAAILDELRAELPDTVIHVQSVMPRGRRWMSRITRLNVALEELTRERGLVWVDLWPAMSHGRDRIPWRSAYDLLHPNAYEDWLRVLRPLVGQAPPATT